MDEVLTKKIMPHSTEAEIATVASMLMDKDAVQIASDMLDKSDFYGEKYGLLFEAMKQLFSEGQPVDLVPIQDRLKQNGAPIEVAGMEFLREILSSVPTSVNIRQYAQIVKNKSILRNMIKTAQDIEEKCYLDNDNIDDLLYSAEKRVGEIAQSGVSDKIQTIGEVAIESLDRIMASAAAGGKITGIPTGFTDLDYKMAGMQNSNLILVAARPAMGKTAFVLNIAQHTAVKHDIPTAFFSLEMGNVELFNRVLAMESHVDSKNIKTGNLSPAEWKNITEGASTIGKSKLILMDTPGLTISEFRNKAYKLKRDFGVKLIIIDYIQLMSGTGKAESRQNEIAQISRELKKVARELDIPIIALSQLSRAVEGRPDKRPMLSDLRESGAIEQDADVVMFIYREDYYKEDTDKKGISEIIIAKQRSGPTGTVELGWLADLTKFVNIAHERKEENKAE